jgi:hypothetical protein
VISRDTLTETIAIHRAASARVILPKPILVSPTQMRYTIALRSDGVTKSEGRE